MKSIITTSLFFLETLPTNLYSTMALFVYFPFFLLSPFIFFYKVINHVNNLHQLHHQNKIAFVYYYYYFVEDST